MENWKRIFGTIWGGQLISVLSSSVVSFAIVFWLSLETGSAEVLGLAMLASMLPQSLLGPFAGVYVDRWNRKRTMIVADSAIALCTLLLAALFALGVAQTWHIYLLLACRSTGSAFHLPAMQASIPLIVPEEQLTRVAGFNQVITALSNIVGPALGALLINMLPIGQILLVDVFGAAVACLSLGLVAIPNPTRAKEGANNLRKEIKEGFQAIGAVRGLGLHFMGSILTYVFIVPIGVIFPLMTLQHFGGEEFEMSLIEILWGGGALIGGAIMGARAYRVNRVLLAYVMNIIVGVAFLLSGLLPSSGFLLFALLTTLEGIAGGVFSAAFISVVQSRVESHALGRVLSIYYSFGMLPAVVGLLGAGLFAEQIGLTTTFIFSGAVIILICSVACFIPSLRALDASNRKERV